MKNINIAFSFDKKFIPVLHCVLTNLLSMKKVSTHYDIYLMTSKENARHKSPLEKLVLRFDSLSSVHFVFVDDFFKDGFEIRGISNATYNRLLLHKLLPNLDKIIYSDLDVYINGDLSDLWNVSVENYVLAAVKGSQNISKQWNELINYHPYWKEQIGKKPGNYFQAGVLVMNLSEIRKMNISNSLYIEMANKKYFYVDQDILNILYRDKVKFISPIYNRLIAYSNEEYLMGEYGKLFSEQERKDVVAHTVIYHFAGEKPWNNSSVPFASLWYNFIDEHKELKKNFRRKKRFYFFNKLKSPNGRNKIYILGIKVFSYCKVEK